MSHQFYCCISSRDGQQRARCRFAGYVQPSASIEIGLLRVDSWLYRRFFLTFGFFAAVKAQPQIASLDLGRSWVLGESKARLLARFPPHCTLEGPTALTLG